MYTAIHTLDWESFWDIATPKQAAYGLLALYGEGAAAAAAASAVAARADGRSVDAEFWEQTRKLLTRTEKGRSLRLLP